MLVEVSSVPSGGRINGESLYAGNSKDLHVCIGSL